MHLFEIDWEDRGSREPWPPIFLWNFVLLLWNCQNNEKYLYRWQMSVPATPFWIPWIRSWISTRTDPQPRPQGAFPWGLGWNDPVKSFDSEWCWVLEQRIYRVDVLSLKNLFMKQNLFIYCAIIINLTQHDQLTWVQVVDHLRSVLAIHTRYCTFLSSENKGV